MSLPHFVEVLKKSMSPQWCSQYVTFSGDTNPFLDPKVVSLNPAQCNTQTGWRWHTHTLWPLSCWFGLQWTVSFLLCFSPACNHYLLKLSGFNSQFKTNTNQRKWGCGSEGEKRLCLNSVKSVYWFHYIYWSIIRLLVRKFFKCPTEAQTPGEHHNVTITAVKVHQWIAVTTGQ